MTEPRRLLDEASGLDRAVLESAIDDQPAAARRRRVVAAIGATSLAASSTAAASGFATWKIVIGLATVGAVAIGGAARLRTQHAAPPPMPSPSAVASALVPAAMTSSLPTPITTVTTVASAPPPKVAKKLAVSEPLPVPSIAREIELIDRARSSLARGAPNDALAALNEYDTECKGGALALEAAVLRIEARAAAGDSAGAAKLADRFLALHPTSAYDARVRAHASKP